MRRREFLEMTVGLAILSGTAFAGRVMAATDPAAEDAPRPSSSPPAPRVIQIDMFTGRWRRYPQEKWRTGAPPAHEQYYISCPPCGMARMSPESAQFVDALVQKRCLELQRRGHKPD